MDMKLTDNRLSFAGAINFSNINIVEKEIRKIIRKLKHDNLVIDLAAVADSDSSLVALMLLAKQQAHKRKILLEVINLPSKIADLARLSNIDKIILK